MAQHAPPIENDEDMQALYSWVDDIPLSRPKRNIARDFADGVLVAEILHHFFPKLVEVHNYSPANSNTQKMYNWKTLNMKVLKRIGVQIHQDDMEEVVKMTPGAIERVLVVVQKATKRRERGSRSSSVPAGPGRREAVQGGRRQDFEHRDCRDRDLIQRPASYHDVDTELLVEKEQTIAELREMVTIMSEKIGKLEQLVRIKDAKIESLGLKLQKHGLA